jgi:hypothetical protein
VSVKRDQAHPVATRSKFQFYPVEELLNTALFDVLELNCIHSPTPAVGFYHKPGPPQNIGPIDSVIQSMESTIPAPFGRKI